MLGIKERISLNPSKDWSNSLFTVYGEVHRACVILKCQFDKMHIRKYVLTCIKATIFKRFGHALKIVEKTSKYPTQMHFLRWVKYTCQNGLWHFEKLFFVENLEQWLSGLPIVGSQTCSQHPLAVKMSRLGSLLYLFFLFQWQKQCYILAFVFGQNNEINFLSWTCYIMVFL